MLIRQFFANLASELNTMCERSTNSYLNQIGSNWSSSDFEICDDEYSFYVKSLGCSDHYGYSCDKCNEIIENYKEDFKEIFSDNKIDKLLEKVDNLSEVVKKLQEENTKILEMLKSINSN